MKMNDRVIQALCAALLALCFGASVVLSGELTEEAGRAELTYADSAVQGNQSEVALGVAMGAFRGLFVNYLWIRANHLKEEGKFYEAMELSDAITRLQPRFPKVWAFHAWNMSYNISVATNTAQERWQWVKAGIDLLRSEGIPRNSNDVSLHRELAWIFIHKVQGFADDANRYYKRELAKEWTIVLGPPPVDPPLPEDPNAEIPYDTAEAQTRRMLVFLREMAEAPDTLEGVYRFELGVIEEERAKGVVEQPDTAQRPVRELVEAIRNDAGLELGMDLLRFIELRRAIALSGMLEQGYDLADGQFNEKLDALMMDERFLRAWRLLLPYVRKRVVVEQMHMEPARMVRYTEKFGPLDWRHAAAHSIYWASRGVEEGLERRATGEFDTVNTDRIVMHSIQELTRFGSVSYDLLNDEYFASYNLAYVPKYGEMVEELRVRAGISDDPDRPFRLYSAGYENFMKDMIRVAFRMGYRDVAEQFRSQLIGYKGINFNDPGLQDELVTLPLEVFVEKQLIDRLMDPQVAKSEIWAALEDGFLRGVLQRSRYPKLFRNSLLYAAQVHKAYFAEQERLTFADVQENRTEFIKRSFAEEAGDFLYALLERGSLQLNQRLRIYDRAGPELQALVYDRLQLLLARRMPGMSAEERAAMFPKPPAYDLLQQDRAGFLSQMDDAAVKALIEFEQQ